MWSALLLVVVATAQDPPAPAAQDPAAPATQEAPAPATGEEPRYDWISGPKSLALGNEITLALPPGHVALLPPDADKLMMALGNAHDPQMLALVGKDDPNSRWLLSINFEPEGYVKDDDANELDADALLQSFKDGTEEANADREARGFPPLHVTGWTEVPTYEAATHHLKWGLRGTASEGEMANHFTRVLGRRGFASLQLMSNPEEIEQAKTEMVPVLAGLTFDPGARYEDFDATKDKAAEYGLAALVLGGAGIAAGKAGLFAKLIAMIIAGKKVIIGAVVAGTAAVRRLFGGRAKSGSPPTPPPSSAPGV
jgi:uncharacterized membrane-anchored protein